MNISKDVNFIRYVYLRGLGFSGSGAVIDWLMSTKKFKINKDIRLIEFHENRSGFEIGKFIREDYSTVDILRVRFKLIISIPAIVLFNIPKKILKLLLAFVYPNLYLHKSHSNESSLRTVVLNLFYTYKFYPKLKYFDFEKWFFSKNRIKKFSNTRMIFDQAIPSDLNIFKLINNCSISFFVFRNPIDILKQRLMVEQKTLNLLFSGPKPLVKSINLENYKEELLTILDTLFAYLKIISSEVSVFPIDFDDFISDQNLQISISRILDIEPKYDFSESKLNNEFLLTIGISGINTEIQVILDEIESMYLIFKNLLKERLDYYLQ